jgi:hypothetical protein
VRQIEQLKALKIGIWIDTLPETPWFTKIKIFFNKISKFPPKKSLAYPKMPRKRGVTIKYAHLVFFCLVYIVGF